MLTDGAKQRKFVREVARHREQWPDVIVCFDADANVNVIPRDHELGFPRPKKGMVLVWLDGAEGPTPIDALALMRRQGMR